MYRTLLLQLLGRIKTLVYDNYTMTDGLFR